MQRHVYCLTYHKEKGVRIESLDIKQMNDKVIELDEKSYLFPENTLAYYTQFRIQQEAEQYLIWCLDRENIPKMKEILIHELESDLRYYQRQTTELENIISEVQQLTTQQWERRE